jgi:hypothetical protein
MINTIFQPTTPLSRRLLILDPPAPADQLLRTDLRHLLAPVAAVPPCQGDYGRGPAGGRRVRADAGSGDHHPPPGGDSLSEWLRSIVRWRVGIGLYAYALGLPILIMAAMAIVLAALGQRPDVLPVPERMPSYLQPLLITAVIFGGQERDVKSTPSRNSAARGS